MGLPLYGVLVSHRRSDGACSNQLEGSINSVPTLLSLLVTILVGLEGILHFREHWKNYDLMKSFLRQESCMFQARAGAYRGKGDSEAFVLLVERVEDAISKERAQTIQMRTARSSEPSGPKGDGPKDQPPRPNASRETSKD